MTKAKDEAIRRHVARMRIEGIRYPEICEQLGISPSAVGRHMKELQRIANEASEDDAKCVRLIEEARLEAATAAIWPRVVEGEEKAIEVWIKLHSARAKMWGLADIPGGDSSATVKAKLLGLLTR